MQTAQLTYSVSPHGSESLCPFRPSTSIFCSTSIMTVAIDSRKRSTYCNTEDFDRCPIFLARVLRGR
jgi:hypothetical protein